MKRFLKSSGRGQKGFTLVELLVVVAILGILAAIVVPNLSSFIGTGTTEAESTELDTVQTAVIAAMADQHLGTITGGTLDAGSDLTVGTTTVGAFLVGGADGISYGPYTVDTDGTVTKS